jgi:hypothetical protein
MLALLMWIGLKLLKMKINKILLATLILFNSITIFAQTKSETQVTKATTSLYKAMVDADSVQLNKLISKQLSYGHSGGVVEDKAKFIEKLTNGKSDFVTMNIIDQTVTILKKTALVRHTLNATTNDNGKAGEVHLKVLLIWQKHKASWKLIARQAVKVTT